MESRLNAMEQAMDQEKQGSVPNEMEGWGKEKQGSVPNEMDRSPRVQWMEERKTACCLALTI